MTLTAAIGGGEVPFDRAWLGETGMATGVLTRWNEYVYAKCVTRPRASATRGQNTCNDVGSLMLAQAISYSVWFHFPYYSKMFGSTYMMPAGYRFLAGCLVGPDGIEPGTKASKRAFVFQFDRVYKPSDGTWWLYDHTMTSIPDTPPPGPFGSVAV